MTEKARVSLKIQGRVQGVFFRAEAQKKAVSLGLTGWVKNCPDSTVECLAEGDKSMLHRFIAWCQSGSEMAQVTNIDVNWQNFIGEFADFAIEH